ncbi:MAG: hypothetical protein IPL08_20230 [Saprospiraceae bacterium]|nr:hypothetical protein [Saprospiraceae bacterium]
MKIVSALFAISLFLVASCKMENKSTARSGDNGKSVGDAYALLNQEDVKDVDVKAMRASALNILEHRYKESSKKTYTILDKDIWVFDAIVKNSNMMTGDSLGGRWIDFKEDLTYDYGRMDKKEGKGKYFYDFDKANLLLIDDNENIKPQEFEVKALNDMLVIVGQYIYKDNNIQTKLTRKASFPTPGGDTSAK